MLEKHWILAPAFGVRGIPALCIELRALEGSVTGEGKAAAEYAALQALARVSGRWIP
jgi:hypothetical protein